MTKPRRRFAPVSLMELNIRLAWQRIAAEQGLQLAAAFWRWKALHDGHELHWLKEPWGRDPSCPSES